MGSGVRERIEQIDRGFSEASETELRSAIITALRQGAGRSIDLPNLAGRVARLLQIASDEDLRALQSAGIVRGDYPTDRRMTAALLDLCAQGLGFPEFTGDMVVKLHITPAGRRALEAEAASPHPLLDAYVAGLAGLPDEVIARLEDAAGCYRAGLLRPAIVMLGVAYEHVIASVAAIIAIKESHHAPRLDKLRQRVQSAPNGDERRRAQQALSVAHVVTEYRNDAGHPRPFNATALEVEELVRHAPQWLRAALTIPTLFASE